MGRDAGEKYKYDTQPTRKRDRRVKSTRVTYTALDPNAIRDLIEAASEANGAVRFGTSRDGGAYAVGVYGDGEYYTEYFRDATELAEFLAELTDVFQAMTIQAKNAV